jgi:hypothetical protein
MPDVDDDHALQIGRLALACGSIESTAAWIAQLLISPNIDISSTVVLALDNFSKTVALARKLVPVTLRKEEETEAAALADDIEKWLTDASRVMARRNTYLHADWIITPASEASPSPSAMYLSRKSVNSSPQDVPIADLRAAVEEAHRVVLRGTDVYVRLLDRTGYLDALLAALPEDDRPIEPAES